MMIGPAIGFIIIGSTLYRFRTKLGIPPSPHAERIGFSFWWGGWGALIWSLLAVLIGFPAPLSWIGMVGAIFWTGLTGIRVSNHLIRNNEA